MSTLRGTALNIPNRFETASREAFDDGWSETEIDLPVVQTEFLADHSKSILSKNTSPDVPFAYSLNPYRGCEHGCVYCYARPTHEYLGFNAALDFETKIMVKHDAPQLLRKEFEKPNWKPTVITLSGNTDCYQPAERQYQLTRKLLEVFLEYKNPVAIITKNALIQRDIDLLSELAERKLVAVYHSITTLDRHLTRTLEPRTSRPEMRLRSLEKLTRAGITTGINIGPVIPGLNDEEIPAILKAAAEAGATSAGYNMLRLPLAVKPIFLDWLEKNLPSKQSKVIARIQMIRGGQLSDPNFGSRMKGNGAYADVIKKVFEIHAKKYGLNGTRFELTTKLFQRPGQLTLF